LLEHLNNVLKFLIYLVFNYFTGMKHMFSQDNNPGMKSILEHMDDMDKEVAKEAAILQENGKFRVKKEVIIRRQAAKRAIMMAKANSDPLFQRYVDMATRLREIRSTIMQKYGSRALSDAKRSFQLAAG
jgi:hypothetical protein